MQYNALELRGKGQYIKNQLLAGGEYTFILYRPPNTSTTSVGTSKYLSGSGYFTYETVRDVDGFYPTTWPKYASGSKASISGSVGLVESPYIFSYVLDMFPNNTPQTSSFTFTPEFDVPVSGVFFRATGDYDMEVSPETEACSIPQTWPGGQNYPTQLQSVLGSGTGTVTLTASPVNIPDRWIVEWDGNQVIDTGYISQNPTSYNTVSPISNNRATLTSSLEGKVAPEGGTYPLTPGGTAPNIILSDGYPEVGNIGTYTFSKNTSTSTANVNVYGPLPSTGWQSTLSCPV